MKDKEKQIKELHDTLWNRNFDGDYSRAKFLYNQGYRKLPEDSVVLSREEYERLKHFEWRVTSGVCMTQKEWFDFCNEDSNRRTCLRIEEREKERKETAEKFAKEMLSWLEKDDIDGRNCVIEVAKQFGVEIKE